MTTPKNEKVTKLYVALDCLLDVRLGTLTMINPDFAGSIAADPHYYRRDEDVFGALTKETFYAIQDKYQPAIIRSCLRTRMPAFIRELMQTLSVQTVATPYHSKVEVEVNTYPYTLEDEEAHELAEVVSQSLGKMYTIAVVRRTYEEMTLSFVRETYRAMIWYKYHDWFNLYTRELQNTGLRDVGFYVPSLWFDHKATPEQLEACEKEGVDPFEMVQHVLSPLVLLQFLPVALYCAATPTNNQTLADLV